MSPAPTASHDGPYPRKRLTNTKCDDKIADISAKITPCNHKTAKGNRRMGAILDYTQLLLKIKQEEKNKAKQQKDFDDAQNALSAITDFYAYSIQDGIKIEQEKRTGEKTSQPFMADVSKIIDAERMLNRLCKKYSLAPMCPDTNDIDKVVDYAQQTATDIIMAAIEDEMKAGNGKTQAKAKPPKQTKTLL